MSLLWHLPRDDQGRLALGERVLLARYERATPLGAGRHPWLVAALPARRRDPQVPTLRLMPLIGANHTHRWDEARWLWDGRETETCPAERRWGFPLPHGWLPTPVDDATEAQPDGAVTRLADPTAPGEVGQVERCLALQDAGELAGALALYGVELAPAVERLVWGEPLGWRDRHLTEPWTRAVQEALRAAAPWCFGGLLADAAAERARWLAEKPGRRRPLPSLRLLRLPKQTGQRKAVLALAARDPDGGRPWVTLEWTGADDRLPTVAWRRDPDLDLLRFGLVAPEDLPYPFDAIAPSERSRAHR